MFSVRSCPSLSEWVQTTLWRCNSTPGGVNSDRGRERYRRKDRDIIQSYPALNIIGVYVEIEVYLKVFVPRHSSVGEFGQEHGNEPRQAPLCSQLAWADSRQPQDMLWDVGGFALEHSTLAQMQGRWCQATEAWWDRQTHAGKEATPSR